MSGATHIAYSTPEIERIVALAEALDGAAKPSGAGGGDCTVALFPTDTAARQFEHRMNTFGLPCISVQPAAGAHMVTT